jgi:hypothetical protein
VVDRIFWQNFSNIDKKIPPVCFIALSKGSPATSCFDDKPIEAKMK